VNTRRYHGLLVAATHPPAGRMVLLSKLEETLVAKGRRYEFSCNRYPGVVHPQGYLHLKEFRLSPVPTYIYEIDGIEIEKSIFLVHGENTVVVQYEVRGAASGECYFEIRPLIAFRDYHSTTHENGAINPALSIEPGRVTCSPYQGCPSLHLGHSGADVRPEGVWYRNFEYTIEQERGLDYREDLFNPLVLTFDLHREPRVELVASTEPRDVADAAKYRQREIARRDEIAASANSADPFARMLFTAASQFIVQRGSGSTVIAGYHWFTDWGRDTMIALPGLALATRRHDAARGILTAFAASADRGMLPNRFPDAGETPEYNTVDATLWFFEATRAYGAHTGDYDFIRGSLYNVLADIIAWHERGTRYGIHVDSDGLLSAGEPGVQLTWMDAKVGDWVVTPRYGKPVEIQALWYNALRVMEDLADRVHDTRNAEHYREMADRARTSFVPLFWNELAGCLYDTVDGDRRDASIRPNQIFAISLHHSMLDRGISERVLSVVERELVTPFGLRTLAPSDPQYRGRFEGGPSSRDGAYHQGTVWPWLLGPFLTAYREAHGNSEESAAQAREWLTPLRHYMENEGVGQLPEVFDGDAPHRAGGCLAQAWSVAEILRVLVEFGVDGDPKDLTSSARVGSL
jgi:predicted glycogen debranching enzyme